ncbi:MAG: hypothetical protein OXK80_03265 [Bdellovibrionales bacterium]|nr:hypothetical protein [Bdellovibrionales bacterium]
MTLIILSLHLLFGLWFAYQTYTDRSQKVFSEFAIKSCIFSYLVIILLALPLGTLPLVFSIYIPIFIFVTIEYFWSYKRLDYFQKQFLSLLDFTIARMKMGNSFREALNQGIESIDSKWVKEDLKELRDRIVYSQDIKLHQAKEFLFAFKTFKQVDKDPQPLTRLHYIREAMKIEDLFRKKSHQALLQVRLQSAIMSILYLALFIFVIWYHKAQFLTLMLVSLCLFITGSALIFILGRKIRWTL